MSAPERTQAAAAQLAKDFSKTVGAKVEERLRELETCKELPRDDAKLWNLMLELPTKRLQKTESLSWSYYEPLLRGLLDEHAVNFQAEDEETARAAQWSYKLVLAELDEQIQLEREEAELALSGPWNLHAMQDAFDHQYDRDRVCEYDLHDEKSRAAYWTVYVLLGAFSQLRPAESQLPVLAARIKEAFERKAPSNLTAAYLVLIKLAEQLHIPRGEWHDGWSRVFRPRQDQLPLPPRPKDVDRYHAKRFSKTGKQNRPDARRELHANYAHQVAKRMEMADAQYLEHLADDSATHWVRGEPEESADEELKRFRGVLNQDYCALFRPRLDAFFDMRLPMDEDKRNGEDKVLSESEYSLFVEERHQRINGAGSSWKTSNTA
ncbi:hypothetical protein JCM8115_003769 [Rhodotorula mucilaginosa]